MTKFLIETNEVETVSDAIKELSTNARNVARSIDSYDVNNGDFDFAGAKEAILTNAKGAYGKFKITSNVLKKVVETHTTLQNSVNGKGEEASKSNNNSGGNNYNGGGHSGGGASGGTTPTSQTPTTDTTTPTPVNNYKAGEIKNGEALNIAIDLNSLLATVAIKTIEDIKDVKDNLSLVLTINKNDPKFEELLELIYRIADKYGIALSIIYTTDDSKSLSLVKNGEEISSITDLTKENIINMLDNAPEDIKKEYKMKNDFIYYNQGEYKDYAYAGETIAAAGCGPTSTAMVLTYLTGETVTPVEAAAYSTEHGFAVDGNGTSEGLFKDMAEAYNLKAEVEPQKAENITASLQEGKVIIAHMGPGTFTKGGHYIVLMGLDKDGNVLVADPASYDRTLKTYPPEIFEKESRGQMTSIWPEDVK